MNVALRHGLHGLGEEEVFDPETEGIDWEYVTEPDSTTTLVTGGGYVGAPVMKTTGGYAGVTPVAGSTGLDPAALAKALTAGTLIVSKLNPGTGKPACPSGYQYPNGSCLPVAASAAPKPLLAGVSNQTLAIVGIGFLFLMMMGGGGRHR